MRKFMTLAAAVAFVLGLSVASASAADKPERTPEALFKRMDANADGKLTVEEFIGKRTERADKAKEMFAKLDKNSDAAVDLEEFKAMRARKKAK